MNIISWKITLETHKQNIKRDYKQLKNTKWKQKHKKTTQNETENGLKQTTCFRKETWSQKSPEKCLWQVTDHKWKQEKYKKNCENRVQVIYRTTFLLWN